MGIVVENKNVTGMYVQDKAVIEVRNDVGGVIWSGAAPPPLEPINYENFDFVDEPVPAGYDGAFLTLIGGGAGGGGGRSGTTGNRPGGGGGGGAARIERVWVPRSSMGSTWTLTRGYGSGGVSTPSTAGKAGSSFFSSGSVNLNAGGGSGGRSGVTTTAGTGGSGGTATAAGISVDPALLQDGTAGGNGSATSAAGGSAVFNSVGGGPGGGGGGGTGTNDTSGGAGQGGNSLWAAGDGEDVGPGLCGGGGNGGNAGTAGHPGGIYGAGGGGGSTKNPSRQAGGGSGGAGYTLIEWIPS